METIPRKKRPAAAPMVLNQGIPVELGNIKGFIFGGPFKNYVPGTRRLIGVKMAREINHPHEISIPTDDYSIPNADVMDLGIIGALIALENGNDIYAGCMGGIGRTGLFMGCMAKVMLDYYDQEGLVDTAITDPVVFVRQNYMSHAIETEEQQEFVRTFDTSCALQWVTKANTPDIQKVEVPVTVQVLRWPSWSEFLRQKFGFGDSI